MESTIRELRYAVRALAKQPSFTIVAVLTIALGIGANTAMFSIVDAAMLRPLPYPDADRLVSILLSRSSPNESTSENQVWWSYPKYNVIKQSASTLQLLAAFAHGPANLTGIETPRRVQLKLVSPSYFSLLGVDAVLGRTFLVSEDLETAGNAVAVLSHALWRDQYGGDPDILGKPVQIDETQLVVIGVLPRNFQDIGGNAQVWVPITMAPTIQHRPDALTWWGTHWHRIIGRLDDNATMEESVAELSTIGVALDEQFPSPFGVTTAPVPSPLTNSRLDPTLRRSMTILMAAVAFVLLIACINVAGLFSSRAADLHKEIAIRFAIGASKVRVARQVLLESVLISVAGATIGVITATLGLQQLTRLIPAFDSSYLFQTSDVFVSWRVLAFTTIVAVSCGIFFGVMPAFQSSRGSVASSLRMTRHQLGKTRRFGSQHILISAQFALATLLLAGAGLMLQSFARLQSVDSGFHAEGVLTARLHPNVAEPRAERLLGFKRALLEKIRTIPGVQSASLSNCTPLSGQCFYTTVTHADNHTFIGDDSPFIGVQYVGAQHFETMGIPIRRGRAFSQSDHADSPPVLVINETAAQMLWPNEDPIGKHLAIGEPLFLDHRMGEVIGVVGDVKYAHPSLPVGPDAYLSTMQGGPASLVLVVKTNRPTSALSRDLRTAVNDLDANLPIYDVMSMNQRVAFASDDSRFNTLLLGLFAGLALLLAAVGLYGTLSYRVSQSTKEIGLRIALGAAETRVLRWLLRQGFTLAAFGVMAGTASALFANRVLEGLLYDISPTDPRTLLVVSILLVLVGGVATYLPARRAAKVDPMVALRSD